MREVLSFLLDKTPEEVEESEGNRMRAAVDEVLRGGEGSTYKPRTKASNSLDHHIPHGDPDDAHHVRW
jgi:hypothetical protein